jgi:hypothetical protein
LFTRGYNIARNHFLCDRPENLLTLQPPLHTSISFSETCKILIALSIGLRSMGQLDTFPCRPPSAYLPPSLQQRSICVQQPPCTLTTSRLCTNFFKSCYIPDYIAKSETASTMVEKILAQQLSISAETETITRAMLPSAYVPGDIDEVIKRAVKAASEEVLNLLRLISGGDELFARILRPSFGRQLMCRRKHSIIRNWWRRV